jgi:hypothetical protein
MVCHQDFVSGRITIDTMEVWQGNSTEPVPIRRLYDWIDDKVRHFDPGLRLVLDPYQLEELAQHYEKQLPVERFESRGGKSNYEMAIALQTAIVQRQIVWYPGCGTVGTDTLVDELASLVVLPTSYGYRFDHLGHAHDDRAVCLGMAVVTLLHRPAPARWVKPKPVEREPRPGIRQRESNYAHVFGMGERKRL